MSVKIYQPVIKPDKHKRDRKASLQAYYQSHKQNMLDNAKQWAIDNPDKIKETLRKYREKDPEKYRARMRIAQQKIRDKQKIKENLQ
jgi:hypothetical protein